MLVILICIYCR